LVVDHKIVADRIYEYLQTLTVSVTDFNNFLYRHNRK